MKKTILLLLFLTTYTLSNAQSIIPFVNKYKEATLYFRDGTIQNGLAKITSENKIKFKITKESEKQIFSYKNIDKITLKIDGEKITRQYKIYRLHNIKKPQYKLLKIEVKGKLSLYSATLTQTSAPGTMGGFSYSRTSTVYYLEKGNNDTVAYEYDRDVFRFRFHKNGPDFFKDCPVLAEKIASKELGRGDMIEIVKFYNKNCGKN